LEKFHYIIPAFSVILQSCNLSPNSIFKV
jgi:hypothetical protein